EIASPGAEGCAARRQFKGGPAPRRVQQQREIAEQYAPGHAVDDQMMRAPQQPRCIVQLEQYKPRQRARIEIKTSLPGCGACFERSALLGGWQMPQILDLERQNIAIRGVAL